MAKRGWQKEPARHSLAARGLQTRPLRKNRCISPREHRHRQLQAWRREEEQDLPPPKSDFLFYRDKDLEAMRDWLGGIPMKMVRDPKKWYTHRKHTGWRKTQSASTRRAKLLSTTPKNWSRARRYRLAGRRAQALANVTQDKQTAKLSAGDAAYFFDKLARLTE